MQKKNTQHEPSLRNQNILQRILLKWANFMCIHRVVDTLLRALKYNSLNAWHVDCLLSSNVTTPATAAMHKCSVT